MNTGSREEAQPKPIDLEGWKQAAQDGRLGGFRLESIAAAFQDLGPRDAALRNSLAKYLSETILRLLRRRISPYHPNRGEDIMLRAHNDIFAALLRPNSADGRGLREAFVPRVMFRLKDALLVEARQHRIPDETFVPRDGKSKSKKNAGISKRPSSGGDESAGGSHGPSGWKEDGPYRPSPVSLDGVDETDEQIDVTRILECVPDERKRLAFRLYMDEVPFKSKRKGVTSIAGALGISDKTAREWIKEVQDALKVNDNVRSLKTLRAGDSV